jgi:hypothetical protein
LRSESLRIGGDAGLIWIVATLDSYHNFYKNINHIIITHYILWKVERDYGCSPNRS